uniref:Uncharacterized protein n=1 Tax=Roseihalotalea indica TaxID=2867963 RepID=A0AA49JJ26_9BACT|nr:hypothetical protein K4G66_05275 [Tunicatimonas sp. TK19036]
MKEWKASRKVWKWCLLGLFWFGMNQYSFGQCPSVESVSVQVSSKSTFSQSQGQLTFLFNTSIESKSDVYRIRLYDADLEKYVYDDNNPPFLNKIPAPKVDGGQVSFSSLPIGRYALEIHGGECQYQRYQANSQD